MIPYGKQDINQSDIDAVVQVLRSDFLTQGPQVPLFEDKVSKYCGAEYAVAVNSATSALHIACLAIGLENGDRLWTSPNSYVASANCGLYCGASVDFVDIDISTCNLSDEALEKKLIKAKADNLLPKVVIPVHFSGQSCNMERIYALSLEYGFRIIEDASHAIGGQYLDHKIGSCQYSDITIFSFHPVKIITTAEGGMATTNNADLLKKMQLLRSHGVTRDGGLMTKATEGDWYYQQVALGFNFRMNELQATLGVSQMNRLDEFVVRRNVLRQRYDSMLADLPVTPLRQIEGNYSAVHLYPITFNSQELNVSRKKVFEHLRNRQIYVNVHYIPIHTQPYYQKMGFSVGDFPNSEAYYESAITLPLFASMTFQQQNEVVAVLREALC